MGQYQCLDQYECLDTVGIYPGLDARSAGPYLEREPKFVRPIEVYAVHNDKLNASASYLHQIWLEIQWRARWTFASLRHVHKPRGRLSGC